MHKRCFWVNLNNPLYIQYHDEEWGKLITDDTSIFEMICLEGQQAGLSWEIILNKRNGYRKAFFNFDIESCANLSDEYLESQITNPEIIRSKSKIASIRDNAQIAKGIIEEFGSLYSYLVAVVGSPKQSQGVSKENIQTQSEESIMLAKDLKKRGIKYIGPTIAYSFMQAIGLNNDHEVDCDFR